MTLATYSPADPALNDAQVSDDRADTSNGQAEDGFRLLDQLFKTAVGVLHEAHMAGKVMKRGRLRKSVLAAAQQLSAGVLRRPNGTAIAISSLALASMPIICHGADERPELRLGAPSDYAKLDGEAISAEGGPIFLRLEAKYEGETFGCFAPCLWEQAPETRALVSFVDALHSALETRAVAGTTAKSVKEQLDVSDLCDVGIAGKDVLVCEARLEKVKYHTSIGIRGEAWLAGPLEEGECIGVILFLNVSFSNGIKRALVIEHLLRVGRTFSVPLIPQRTPYFMVPQQRSFSSFVWQLVHPLWRAYGRSYASDDRINPFWHKGESLVQDRPDGIDAALKPFEDVLGFDPPMVASLLWHKECCVQLRELCLLMLALADTKGLRGLMIYARRETQRYKLDIASKQVLPCDGGRPWAKGDLPMLRHTMRVLAQLFQVSKEEIIQAVTTQDLISPLLHPAIDDAAWVEAPYGGHKRLAAALFGLYTGRVSLHTQSTDMALNELEVMVQSHLKP